MAPVLFQWDGEAMRPATARWAVECNRCFVVGEEYRMEAIEDRSAASHNHYFSCIQGAFDNLPEKMAGQFATPDHLRRYALIKAGYRDERSIVCASRAEALRIAAFIRPMDEYAVVVVSEAVVRVYTAQSQSYRAMGKEQFGKSKEAVLEIISEMIGSDVTALSKAAA
jgi:hypothetical protein